jgi:hypothetical protein
MIASGIALLIPVRMPPLRPLDRAKLRKVPLLRRTT